MLKINNKIEFALVPAGASIKSHEEDESAYYWRHAPFLVHMLIPYNASN